MPRLNAPSHPGEILREEFLAPVGTSAADLAAAIGIDQGRVTELLAERSAITADMATRLSRRFGTTPDFWMTLQANHDLAEAARTARAEYEAIEPLQRAG